VIKDKRVLALVPARGGSKGLHRKNIIELCGKPLLGWPIQAARLSKYVDEVIVSTEDAEIAEKARKEGAELPFMRPVELATDTASSFMVAEHAIQFLERQGTHFDYLVLLEPTSPLTEASDIDMALERLLENKNIADSIISVSKIEATHPAFDVSITDMGIITPYLTAGLSGAGRRQDISDLYFFDGSLYISDIPAYLLKKTFYHDRTLAHVSPKWKSLEVDDFVDFVCVEAIMKNVGRIKETETQKENKT
jgi:CMP-N,N'-diacetyllegionaminic acid synthase